MAKRKYKKPIHCPVCNKAFSYSAKTAPIARLSKHLAKAHPTYKRKRKKKTKSKNQIDARQDQLLDELQLFDDLTAQKLGMALVPNNLANTRALNYPTTEHESVAGAIITALKIGMAVANATKTGVETARAIKKAKSKKK